MKEQSLTLHNSKFSACVILKEHFFHPPFVVSVAVLIINIHKSEAMILEILERLERLRFTFMRNGKRKFVPRDQVFPLTVVYRLLLLHKNK